MEEDTQNYSPTVMFRGTPCSKEKLNVVFKFSVFQFSSVVTKMLDSFHREIRETFFKV